MERYVFLFKRQQYEYLTKSVALASGALLLTSAATAVGLLFAKDAIGASVFGGTFAWLLFFVPALTVRYRHFICGRIPFRLFFAVDGADGFAADGLDCRQGRTAADAAGFCLCRRVVFLYAPARHAGQPNAQHHQSVLPDVCLRRRVLAA